MINHQKKFLIPQFIIYLKNLKKKLKLKLILVKKEILIRKKKFQKGKSK